MSTPPPPPGAQDKCAWIAPYGPGQAEAARAQRRSIDIASAVCPFPAIRMDEEVRRPVPTRPCAWLRRRRSSVRRGSPLTAATSCRGQVAHWLYFEPPGFQGKQVAAPPHAAAPAPAPAPAAPAPAPAPAIAHGGGAARARCVGTPNPELGMLKCAGSGEPCGRGASAQEGADGGRILPVSAPSLAAARSAGGAAVLSALAALCYAA